jgi:small neutral amino acid transporter SnatA (MarC family)
MTFFWEAFVTLFVIIDPPGTVPVFLGLTRGRSVRTRHRLAWQAAVVAFGTGQTEEPTSMERAKANVAFVPLGTPLLAGPGAIVATMLYVQRVHSVLDALALALAICAVAVTAWLSMRFAEVIQRVLTDNGVELLTRIAGLLLSAIAIQLVAQSALAFAAQAG